MKELSLQEVKDIELDILIHFNEFCKSNNIRYFLAFGTLLGAVRYHGFIPWDDDVDVLVPREDYNRLISLFQDDDKYRLYAFERNGEYRFPFAKLTNCKTRLIELAYPNNGVDLGVSIDVFPLDYWHDDYKLAQKEVKKIARDVSFLGWTKANKIEIKNPIRFVIWKLIIAFCKLQGSGHYIKKITNRSTKYNKVGSVFAGAKVWPIWGERCIIPAEVFTDCVDIEFEGEMFPAPIGYDTYLTCLYGDYMPEPPVEKRKTHHSFKAYRL